MDYEMEVEVFRTGDYGPRGTYDADALDRLADDYSLERHEAPVTTDHRQEGPAQGWVRSLRRAGDVLVARLGGLTREFLDNLKSGAFKKRSVELYRAFEATGQPYLRAVTFLGAGAPVVKGLADPVFAETDETVYVEFRENDAAQSDASSHPVPSTPSASSISLDAETERFCREMREAGRLLPAWEEQGIAYFMAALDNVQPRRFAKGDETPELTARAWFREFLQSLPAMVPMGEIAPVENVAHFRHRIAPAALPENWRGVRIDNHSVVLHQEVVRYCQAHPKVAYAEALGVVCVR